MSFAAPVWLALAGLVAAGVVIAHLITISQPRRDVLPTVRFIPQTAPVAVTRTRRPTDLLLLLARLLAIALLGLALAGAHVTRTAPPRVVIVDLSRSVADSAEVRDSVRTLAEGDAVLVALGDTVGPETLSGALVAAHRAVAGRDHTERTELVIISPVSREQVDSATAPLIALWPGSVRVARARAAPPNPHSGLQVRASGDDPVAAALQRKGEHTERTERTERAAETRVFRSEPPAAGDTAWVRQSGGVLVVWPADLTWLASRVPVDTQQGIAAGSDVVIGSFARTHVPRDGRVVARWLDGQPAATEVSLGTGCLREVAIPVDAAGDMALRESFRGIARTLTSPCAGPRDIAPADLASIIPRDDRERPAAAAAGAIGSALPAWLAIAALAVLLAEQLLRRRNPVVRGTPESAE